MRQLALGVLTLVLLATCTLALNPFGIPAVATLASTIVEKPLGKLFPSPARSPSVASATPVPCADGSSGASKLTGEELKASGTATAIPCDGPNIILILTDDLDLGSVDLLPGLKTAMSQQGTTFENFFVSDALSYPSRASILRGQYSKNHKVLSNYAPTGGFQKFYNSGNEKSTLATWLKSAGYRTALIGKYFSGYPTGVRQTYVPPGWDEWFSTMDENEASSSYGYKLVENGSIVEYGNRSADYLTDVLAGKAKDFIRRAAVGNRPFFIYLAPDAPNLPATPAPRHLDVLAKVVASRSPSFDEADVSDKPEWLRSRSLLSDDDVRYIDKVYRDRVRSMLAVEDMLKSLIETLLAAGKLEHTYIFFTSDNGFHLGQHRLPPGKNTVYEEDIRVPLIVRGPGITVGGKVDRFALNVDLAPTIAELAGVKAPDFVDGRSLVPLLRATSASANWRQSFLVEHFESRDPAVVPEFRAVRTNDYVYVEYDTGERELYDLRSDPYELNNLYARADPQIIGPLAGRLEELRRCAGPTCRSVEDAPLEVAISPR